MRNISIKSVFLLLVGIFMLTCQHDPDFQLDEATISREVGVAKQWYEANRPGEVSLRSAESNDGSPAIEVKPDWGQAYAKANKREKTVETNLYMKGGIHYVIPENKDKFEATGDARYMSSLTRLIVKTKLRDGAVDGFLMTIMPSVEYLELTGFRAFDEMNYIGRDKQFTGRIIYHNLEGEFVNGWVYHEGKITHSIRRPLPDEDPVISLRSSGSYDCYIIEHWDVTVVCTDWFQYTNIDPIPIYTGTTCSDPRYEPVGTELQCSFGDDGDGENGGNIDGEDGEYGGGGGGGSYYNPPLAPVSQTLNRIAGNISMTNGQRILLNMSLEAFIAEGCMQRALYDDLVERNVKLNFGINANITLASYNPNNKSINFKDYNSITLENLKEELFHAWQDAYYPGGTSQYGKDAQGNKLAGYVNVEFEAKVFKDIIMEVGSYSAFFNQDTAEQQRVYSEYINWIENVKDNLSILQDQNVYDYWLDLFIEHNPHYFSAKSNDFSSFLGLYDLINLSNCF